jgi:hypothetical protein
LWCSFIFASEWHLLQVYDDSEDGWQVAHFPSAPRCVIGNLCGPLYEIGSHALVVWHSVQTVPYELGCDAGFEWQLTHALDSPVNVELLWHFPQEMPRCAPVSLNPVRSWSNVAGSHLFVE